MPFHAFQLKILGKAGDKTQSLAICVHKLGLGSVCLMRNDNIDIKQLQRVRFFLHQQSHHDRKHR